MPVLAVQGCAKRPLAGYETAAAARPRPGTRGPAAGAALGPAFGLVDVICLPGAGQERGVPDTLFGCLLHARDQGLGRVDLPSGVYLGHVAEFIVRALEFYEIEGHFERFYGYRVVLRLRPASEDEASRARRDGYLRTALGAAGEATMFLLGAAAVPLAPMVFLFESVQADDRRRQWADAARAQGLPEPTRTGPEVVAGEYGRRYAMLLGDLGGGQGGGRDEDVLQAWVVEECYLEKPEQGEVLALAARWGNRAGPGQDRDFPSQKQ